MQIVGEVTAEQSGFVGFGVGRKGSFWVAHKGRQTPPTHGATVSLVIVFAAARAHAQSQPAFLSRMRRPGSSRRRSPRSPGET
jgi:hypothetical protein